MTRFYSCHKTDKKFKSLLPGGVVTLVFLVPFAVETVISSASMHLSGPSMHLTPYV